jgi:hypothetical protein
VDDVERISWGKPAKKKGTGSRGVPHRLNQHERELFDVARRRGYLDVEGSGWRSQRREAPLLNTYRSLCDARGRACIVLHKKTVIDELVVDLSPLRNPAAFDRTAKICLERMEGGEVTFQGLGTIDEAPKDGEDAEDAEIETTSVPFQNEGDRMAGTAEDGEVPTQWESRPIYHLPPCCISWELPRSEAKALAKSLSMLFDTKEGKSAGVSSRKPVGVKPGKSRQHGGYGIG